MIPSTHDECKSAVTIDTATMPGLDSFGNYNTAPEPMVTITAEEYSRRLLHWQVTAIESRQPKVLGYSALCIHWLNTGNGVGMSRTWQPSWVTTMGPEVGYWKPEYWLIGCPHNNMVTTKTAEQLGKCLHEQVCQDCGYTTVVDSSG